MRKFKISNIIDIGIVLWMIIWLYYILFNWEIFRVSLSTNLGFAVVNSHPFVFFMIISLLILIAIRISSRFFELQDSSREKERKSKLKMLEKDIEILQLKEVLYKMQTEGLSKSSSKMNALQQKLERLTRKHDIGKEELN